MINLIFGGWILIIGHSESGNMVVVPTSYETKQLCEDAANEAKKGLPWPFGYRCIRSGEAKG